MDDALVTVLEYYKAFSTLELEPCAPFFSMPCIFLGRQGTFAVNNKDDLAKVLGPTFAALKAKDFQRSEFLEPQTTMLTDNTAMVRGVAVRYQTSGTELARIPITYLLHKSSSWKIAVSAAAL